MCSFSHVIFGEIIVAVAVQIVLSWLLSDTIKTKNIFVKDRLNDIKEIKREIEASFSIRILFKYVPKHADMITRGVSISKLKTNFDFWVRGGGKVAIHPSWRTSDLNFSSAGN